VAELRELGHLPDMRADWLARQVYQRKFPLVIPGPIFIWWANGTEWLFCDDFEKATAKIELSDPRLAGAVIVLNLRHTGRALVERLGRAAVHVEFPDLPAQPDGKPSS
jgi:phage tail protein X